MLWGDYVTILAYGHWGPLGWYPVIEINPENHVARVCTQWYTDVDSSTCQQGAVECASSGSIQLSAVPELGGIPVKGYMDVTFEGFSLSGSFTYRDEYEPISKL